MARVFFFFFNDTATTEIYTLSLHDALPICAGLALAHRARRQSVVPHHEVVSPAYARGLDRKSTRLNSSHGYISYAVFCLKKKKNIPNHSTQNDVSSLTFMLLPTLLQLASLC